MSYVKVGPNAESFSDPFSGFNIVKGEVKILTAEVKNSPKVKRALTGGHLSMTDEKSYMVFLDGEKKRKLAMGEIEEPLKSGQEKAYKKEIKNLESEKIDLVNKNLELQKRIEELEGVGPMDYESMTKDELTKYYKDTYDVTEDDIKAFSDKKKDEMIAELEELEEAE